MSSDKGFFRESSAAGLKKWGEKFTISLDPAFEEDSDQAIINCPDNEKKPHPCPQNSQRTNEGKTIENVNFELILLECNQEGQKAYASKCAKSGRTEEWIETSWEYKGDHSECEYCGEIPDKIESHDILPYSRLNEDQRHDRNFLKQNLISLCHEHHHNVAHLGDPDWIKFEPGIREICDRERQKRHVIMKEYLKRCREETERDLKRTEDLRSYVRNMPGNKLVVDKMISDKKRRM
jgi:hypothetical protein